MADGWVRRHPGRVVLGVLVTLIVLAGLVLVTTQGTGGGHGSGAGRKPVPAAVTSIQQQPVVPQVAEGTPRVLVSLTFDDGYADALAGARLLSAYRMRGTFYLVSGWVGMPGWVSMADVRGLSAAGDEIGGHTVLHPMLVTVNPDELSREICDDRMTWARWGFPVTSFAYPYSSVSGREESIARSCGYNSARQLGALRSPKGCDECAVAETVPPPDPYFTRAPAEVDTSWTLASLQSVVTNAEAGGGGWVQITFHHVCDGCGQALAITPELLKQFLAWLSPRAATGTVVRTVNQVVTGPTQPAHPGPVPQPVPAGANGVHDASLETAGQAASGGTSAEGSVGLSSPGDTPKCWQTAGFGTNTAHWSRTTDAHSGQYAERLQVTGYRSGDAKLLPTLDLGDCAPTVVPGRQYTVSAWYKSTAATGFVLFYRNPVGAWTTWKFGPSLPAHAGWTHAVWRSPPVPAGATGLSFGLRLVSNGTLTTDDYGLVQAGTG